PTSRDWPLTFNSMNLSRFTIPKEWSQVSVNSGLEATGSALDTDGGNGSGGLEKALEKQAAFGRALHPAIVLIGRQIEARRYLLLRHAGDLDDLTSGRVADGDADAAVRQAEPLRKKRLQRVVRAPALRRSDDLDLQPLSGPADDLVTPRTCSDLDRQART